MIAHDDSIKLTDFGLAVFNADPSNVAVDVSPSGTPAYMPPEQFRHGSNIDQRSDIYSFGIVLYEIITGGQLPFKLGNVPDGHLFEYFH
jgi:serine/threonine-protein kinase